jgi:hypothetical protein
MLDFVSRVPVLATIRQDGVLSETTLLGRLANFCPAFGSFCSDLVYQCMVVLVLVVVRVCAAECMPSAEAYCLP